MYKAFIVTKKAYLVKCSYVPSNPNTDQLCLCESLEEAKSVMEGFLSSIINIVIGNPGIDFWKDDDGKSVYEGIEKGKFYIKNLLYAEIFEGEINEQIPYGMLKSQNKA